MTEINKEEPVKIYAEKPDSDTKRNLRDSSGKQTIQQHKPTESSDAPVEIYAEVAGNVINNTEQVNLPEKEKHEASNEAEAQFQQDKKEAKESKPLKKMTPPVLMVSKELFN